MNTGYRFGIEEELFLADADTRGTARRAVKAFHKDIHERLPKAERELLESQVEISSPPSTSFAEARLVLAGLRNDLADIGHAHRILVLAAATHPIAQWSRQKQTKKERYDTLTRDMQMVARRNLVCGMHVHVEVPKPGQRVDLMNRLLPYMPLLLALSAPRTGLPDLFRNATDYERYVAVMVQSQAITAATFLWWVIRPSIHYPTLELRVADSCTRLEDTLAIAAIYRCLVRLVVRRPDLNRRLTGASGPAGIVGALVLLSRKRI